MSQDHARTVRLIGQEGLDKLRSARVTVFGLGGVGGAVVWALARAGVGCLTLIDCDAVARSNLNRQMVATYDTIGMRKVDAAAQMVRACSSCHLHLHDVRAQAQNIEALCMDTDYIVDAIDDCDAKEALAVHCVNMGIPILSSMGTGNKLDASGFFITDLAKTCADPLARAMRKRLRAQGIVHLPVCISTERAQDTPPDENGRRTPASISFVPPTAGLVIAAEVTRQLLARPLKEEDLC